MVIRSVFVGAVLVALLPGVGRSQEINTTTGGVDNWIGGLVYSNQSTGGDIAVGQVFTVPAATTFLNTFSFWVAQWSGMGESEFRAHLATWDDGTNTYADVWTSGIYNVTSPPVWGGSGPLATWPEQVFNPSMALPAGQTYLAYLRVSNPITFVASYMGDVSGDVIASRSRAPGPTGLVQLQNGVVQWNPRNWDAAFTADFTSPIPEPGTVLLLATGLIGIGGFGFVRRRRS